MQEGVGQGRQSTEDGGEIESDQHPIAAGWSPGGAGGAITNGSSGGKGGSGRGGSGGSRDEALCCPERPGAVPGIGRRDSGVASQRVGRPLSPPWIGLHDGAAHGDHEGLDDVVIDDTNINDADVARRRRRIHRLKVRSLLQ